MGAAGDERRWEAHRHVANVAEHLAFELTIAQPLASDHNDGIRAP